MDDQLSVFELSLREKIEELFAIYQDWGGRYQLSFADNFEYSIDAFSEDYTEFGFEKCWSIPAMATYFCWAREVYPEFSKADNPLIYLPDFIENIRQGLGEHSTMHWRDLGFFRKETLVAHAILRMESAKHMYAKGVHYDWVAIGGLIFVCWAAHNLPD